MGFNTKSLEILHSAWFHGAPQNAKKANVKFEDGVVNKEIVIEYDLVGTEGNDYSVEIVAGVGNSIDLSAVLSGTKITITLATTAAGALDATKNTAKLIVAEINKIENFTATMNGTGALAYAAAITESDLTGGQYATPCNASSAVIVIDNTIYFTDKPCSLVTTDAWYSAAPTLL